LSNKDGSLTKYGYIPAPKKTPEHASNPDRETVSNKASRRSSGAVDTKMYEVDPLICPQCSHEMKVIAVIEGLLIISFPYTSMKEEIPGGEECLSLLVSLFLTKYPIPGSMFTRRLTFSVGKSSRK